MNGISWPWITSNEHIESFQALNHRYDRKWPFLLLRVNSLQFKVNFTQNTHVLHLIFAIKSEWNMFRSIFPFQESVMHFRLVQDLFQWEWSRRDNTMTDRNIETIVRFQSLWLLLPLQDIYFTSSLLVSQHSHGILQIHWKLLIMWWWQQFGCDSHFPLKYIFITVVYI